MELNCGIRASRGETFEEICPGTNLVLFDGEKLRKNNRQKNCRYA